MYRDEIKWNQYIDDSSSSGSTFIAESDDPSITQQNLTIALASVYRHPVLLRASQL